MLLVAVDPGSEAAKAGFLSGDLLLALDGEPVGTIADLTVVLRKKRGQRIAVQVLGAVNRILWITASERPARLLGPLATLLSASDDPLRLQVEQVKIGIPFQSVSPLVPGKSR